MKTIGLFLAIKNKFIKKRKLPKKKIREIGDIYGDHSVIVDVFDSNKEEGAPF